MPRSHGEPSTSRVDAREIREKNRLDREKQTSSKGLPPNSKHATNMRHPSNQNHPTKAPQFGHGPSQMNPARREGNFPRDPNKPREPQPNPMFPPIVRHDPNGSNSNSTTGIITSSPSTISKSVAEMGDDDKTRPKPQSGQRPPEHFNHKYPNADHRQRREHYQPDGGHHPHKNSGDPSKYHAKPRPQNPGLETKKEEEQNKRLPIHPSNNSKPPPSRTPVAPPPSKQLKTRLSKNGTSESVPILPTHNYGSSNLAPLNPTNSTSSYNSTTSTTTPTIPTISTISSNILTTSTSSTNLSSISHSLSPPDLTNPTAVSHLLNSTPPQQVRQPRESPYPSRTKSSTMPHPVVPNRQRTSTPLSPLSSPPGIPSRSSKRNRTNSSSSEELVPVVKKIDQIPGYESVSISGGIKLPGQVPEMIQPFRDRRREESSSSNHLPPPLQTNLQSQISNRNKDDIPKKELTKNKEDKQTNQVPLKNKIEPIEPVISENSRISSSSLDQSIIDVVSIPEPPSSEAVRLNADTIVSQDDASKSKKSSKHHKSDKKKRKEKSKDKEKDKDRDKEKKKKKHKEKEREKLKESQSEPIKIKIPKDKLNLQPTPEQSTDSNSSSGLKIKIPKDRLVQSENPTNSGPSTTGATTTSQGGLKIKISKDVYENFNKEPRKRSAPDTHTQAPPAKAPRVSESRHRNTTTMPYAKQNGQPSGGGYNKVRSHAPVHNNQFTKRPTPLNYPPTQLPMAPMRMHPLTSQPPPPLPPQHPMSQTSQPPGYPPPTQHNPLYHPFAYPPMYEYMYSNQQPPPHLFRYYPQGQHIHMPVYHQFLQTGQEYQSMQPPLPEGPPPETPPPPPPPLE